MKHCKIFCLVLAAILLTSCTVPHKEEVPMNEMPEKIVLWSYYETTAQYEMLDSLTEGFNTSQDQYVIAWEYVPMDDFNKRLSIGLTNNNLPDLVIIDNPNMYFYISLGLFEDITERIAAWKDKEQYYSTAWQATLFEGQCYGIPFACNSVGLFYNVDQFEKAGIFPPKTWEELKSTAKALTNESVYGFGMSALQSEQGTFQFLPWLYSTDTTIDHLDKTGGTKAFQLIADLVRDGSMPKECINWSQNDLAKSFISGDLAMMENGPWVFPALENADLDFRWDVVRLPIDNEYAAVLGGEDIAVIKGKNVEGAMAFMKFMGNPENVRKTILMYGSVPPRRDVAMGPEWSQDPQWQVFIDQMDYVSLRYQHVRWPMISDAISSQLTNVIVGNYTPEKATEKLIKAINEVID